MIERTDVTAPTRTFSTATLHEAAGRIGALPSTIRAVHPMFGLWGPAFPLRCAAGDNLALHHAVYAASRGDVLVADVGDGVEYGYWGEILSEAAKARSLGGLVLGGGARDSVALAEVGFPVFAARICIRGTVKVPGSGEAVGDPVVLGDVLIRRGDLVVGDADGVVVIPAEQVEQVLADADARDRKEAEFMKRIRQGETTVDLFGLPDVGGSGRA